MRAGDGSSAAEVRAWLGAMSPAIEIGDDGLVLGAGSRLARMAGTGQGRRLAIDADRDRVLALLSVVCCRSVGPEVLVAIEAASEHWQRGDKALANLRLAFAGLPRLDDPRDVARLRLAEYCLDEGLSPRALMQELGLDASALGLGKYNGDEPRVPAGNGIESGRWTFGPGGAPVLDFGTGSSVDAGKPIVVAANGRRGGRGVPPKESVEAEDSGTSVEDPIATDVDPLGVPLLPRPGGGLPVNPPEAQAAAVSAGGTQVDTTASVVELLQSTVNQAVQSVRPGSGAVYGTKVHKAVSDAINALNDPDLRPEQSYLFGKPVNYGTKGAVRLDAVAGAKEAPTAIFDFKTGGAILSKSREQEIRSHLPEGYEDIPITIVRPKVMEGGR